MTINVPGLPIAQPRQRHRVAQMAGRAIATNYTPARHPVNAFKAGVRHEWKAAAGDTPATDGPVQVHVLAFFPRPQSHYGTGRNAGMLKPTAPEAPAKKPDVENVVKAVLDALTGLAYRDDAQVVTLIACKRWGEPGVTVSVKDYEANVE